ncbi:MAG: K(+)-transporting ATPase subunit F [Deltaproteobacteria bacterium]|nr:K(+)-transporting ATPase subunit F [Deltaproteobacteria bacterium]
MFAEYVAGAVLTALVLAYLFFALWRPEKF